MAEDESSDPKSVDEAAGMALGRVAKGFAASEHAAQAGDDLAYISQWFTSGTRWVLGNITVGITSFRENVIPKIAEKLRRIPEERVVAPPDYIAGPTIEALRFTADQAELHEMFANLLATSMDSETASSAHPAFVEIIKQLSPDEAKMLGYLAQAIPHDPRPSMPLVNVRAESTRSGEYTYETIAKNLCLLPKLVGCENPQLGPSYIDNLQRLELINVTQHLEFLTAEGAYDALEQYEPVVRAMAKAQATPEREAVLDKRAVEITDWGAEFLKACAVDDLPETTE